MQHVLTMKMNFPSKHNLCFAAPAGGAFLEDGVVEDAPAEVFLCLLLALLDVVVLKQEEQASARSRAALFRSCRLHLSRILLFAIRNAPHSRLHCAKGRLP